MRWALRVRPKTTCYQKLYIRRFASSKPHDPLRILFCGSDQISIDSLELLRNIQAQRPDLIESIEVLCKTPQKVGRGLKRAYQVLLRKHALAQPGLAVHEVTSFDCWEPPPWNINLIVAVSFGLFIPAHLIKSAKYGGLNVHASELPDLAGAAPLHHTLLQRRQSTGVTLQTLDTERFDQGKILRQWRDIPIPHFKTITLPQFIRFMSPLVSGILGRGITEGDFVPPLKEVTTTPSSVAAKAPRIRSEDKHALWNQWTAQQILDRIRVLEILWNNAYDLKNRCSVRIILSDIAQTSTFGVPRFPTGVLFAWDIDHLSRVLIWTCDSYLLQVSSIKVEGKDFRPAILAAKKSHLIEPYNQREGDPTILWASDRPLE